MYSTYNEAKSVVAEKFVRTFKNKTYKYMTSVSKNVYIDKLVDIPINTVVYIIAQSKRNLLNKLLNTVFDVENNDKVSQFKVGEHVKISKYRNVSAKGCNPNWTKGLFL